MPDTHTSNDFARTSLRRLTPRLTARFAHQTDEAAWRAFTQRLETHFPRLFHLLFGLYGQRDDFFYHLEETLAAAAQAWLERSDELKALDSARERNPAWFQSHQMLGGVCYVDLFAGNLAGIRAQIPYFQELGLTYLHLMPLFKCPEGNSDGGYAVSSYRAVNPALGTLEELRALAAELRAHGISLVVDFVFNHTSDEHAWAIKARAGDPDYRDFYFIFPDRTMPDQYERTLREIFPDEHPGAFTRLTPLPSSPELGIQEREEGAGAGSEAWVWTTFHRFQWDLNYSHPATFTAMAGEMLALANVGVEVLRMDAVAFIWKELGTPCENLPEAHTLIANSGDWWKSAVFGRELVRLMSEQGLFGIQENGVNFLSSNFYSARLTLPSNAPPGPYIALTYVFKNGEIIARKSEGFSVRKIGFERFLALSAIQYPLLYGIVCVILALFTGWLGGVIFKR